MPDISLCLNINCPKKETCYRFLAEPNPHWQAYASFQVDEKGECRYYLPVKKEESKTVKQEA